MSDTSSRAWFVPALPFTLSTVLNHFLGRRWSVWYASLQRYSAGAGLLLLISCGGIDEPQPTAIAIEVSRSTVALPPVSQVVLTATVTGTDLNAPVHWTSSVPGVATVADDGPFGIVTGVAEGTTTVYATLSSNQNIKSAPVTVTVARVPALVSFSVDTAVQQLIVGDSRTFALNPVRAASRVAVTYAFTSSNPSVATVDAATGVITAVGVGTATITTVATGTGAGLNGATLNANAQVVVATIQPRARNTITAGRWSSCALKLSGQAFCWGWNISGQLGDGTTTDRSEPTAVIGGFMFSQISQGYWHTCAIATDTKVYCWGHGANGRLGTGDLLGRLTPTPIVGGASYVLIESGGTHTCALSTANNAICWGYNTSNQLGDGLGGQRAVPGPTIMPPVPVSSISAGLQSTCALTDGGEVYCFDTSEGAKNPQAGGNIYRAVGAGGAGRCVLNARGRVGCLGGAPNTQPVFLEGFVFKSIALSDGRHICGITPTNDAYCWGFGGSGQLGDGSANNRNLPSRVSGGHKFTELALGEFHTCGLTIANEVYCWGSNSNGQLGSGITSSLVPRLVPFTR